MLRHLLTLAALTTALTAPLASQRSVSASSVGTDFCCDRGGHCPWHFLPSTRIVEMPNGEAGFVPEPDVGNLEPYELIILGVPLTPISMFRIDPSFPSDCVLHVFPHAVYAFAQPSPIPLGVPFSMIPPGITFRFQTAILPPNSPRMSNYVEFVWP